MSPAQDLRETPQEGAVASWLVVSTLDEIMPNSLKFCSLELDANEAHSWAASGARKPRNGISNSHFLLIALRVFCNQALLKRVK